jgi:Family of unknown function (DUF5677)
MLKKLEETDLLVPFEIANIPREYREYYSIKRNNFFWSIQSFPEMWSYYLALDDIWLREINDLEAANGPERAFPLMLFVNAHAKIRICIELALSGCFQEARSILRDAIECTAHAHHMLKDPALLRMWLGKYEGDNKKAFKKSFEEYKAEGLFKGLDELYQKIRRTLRNRFASVANGLLQPSRVQGHGWCHKTATQLHRRRRPKIVGHGTIHDAPYFFHDRKHILQRLQDTLAARRQIVTDAATFRGREGKPQTGADQPIQHTAGQGRPLKS